MHLCVVEAREQLIMSHYATEDTYRDVLRPIKLALRLTDFVLEVPACGARLVPHGDIREVSPRSG